jgi:hypothetical protein
MHCIQFVHRNGGSMTILGETPAVCRESAQRVKSVNNGTYICGTVPFEVFKVSGHEYYDVSIPEAWHPDLGEELLRIYLEQG